MAMFGAFIALSLMTAMKLPLVLVFVLAFPIGMLMGALIERIVIRPIRSAPHLNLLIVTIGLWFAFNRSEEHTSELQSLMRISYAVFCLKKKNNIMRQTY